MAHACVAMPNADTMRNMGAMAKRSAAMPCEQNTSITHRRNTRRRGSVLVLVMTLLSILFVLGVTFLATMNFEADMIAAEKRRGGSEQGAETLTDGFGGVMRGGFLDAGGSPFGGDNGDGSGATFAELPGVQNVFSTIEPINMPGDDRISGTADDFNPAYASFTDASRGTGIPVPNGVLLSSMLRNGDSIPSYTPAGSQSSVTLIVCRGGINKGLFCEPGVPEECPGSTCSGPIAVDADGDGIVDSFLSDAKDAGLSPDQIDKLSTQVNGPDSEETDVFVGLRTIPHGGMANLNASHPTIIEAALGLPPGQKLIDADGSPPFFSLWHRPSGSPVGYPNDPDPLRSPRSLYSPSTEEALLRRRGMIPPRIFPPSTLQGDPFLSDWEELTESPPIPFGGDMAEYLFWPGLSGQTETVEEGNHRFTMFAPDEPSNSRGNLMPWSQRIDPFLAPTNADYDLRHLVTTISYDDLLARGGSIESENAASGGQDIIERMFEINRESAETEGDCPAVFPFEYLRYPHDLADIGECCSLTGQAQFDTCERNIRKGRLQVSLGWIDRQLAEVQLLQSNNQSLLARQLMDRIHGVVYDAFYLMIRNAVGENWLSRPVCNTANSFFCEPGTICKISNPGEGRCSASASYFDDVECTTPGQNNANCNADEFCSEFDYANNPSKPVYLCSDKFTGLPRSESRVNRTAASLTANFFDFADKDDIPTRIAIRMMSFDMGVCTGGTQAGRVCRTELDCPGGSVCDMTEATKGKTFDFDGNPGDRGNTESLYVYGLERQPYITEVATALNSMNATVTAWAVELFNPYDVPISLNEYWIYQFDDNGAPQGRIQLGVNNISVPATTSGGPNPFLLLYTDPGVTSSFATTPGAISINGLSFKKGWTLYLVRRINYPNENDPNDFPTIDVIVDQIEIVGQVGEDGITAAPCNAAPNCEFFAERAVAATTPWAAPLALPPTPGGPIPAPGTTHTLGTWNTATDPTIHPVEVNFADTGAFADTAPYRERLPNSTNNPTSVSYPTTGSMLLLMRHANRAITDMNSATPTGSGQALKPITDLAFTTALVGDEAGYDIQSFNNLNPYRVTSLAQKQIDNGRMPIFDQGEDATASTFARNPFRVAFSPHHVLPPLTPQWNPNDPSSKQTPGGKQNLPWGQFVFDYFTAIPLDSAGPFPPCTGQNYNCSPVGLEDAKPRVDLDGLRVHGRINLNAAPATVLQGLPFIPMSEIPLAFQTTISNALGVPISGVAEPIGFNRALAIVAYRDARQIRIQDPNTGQILDTGDYGTLTDPNGTQSGGIPSFGWRGWTDRQPSVRRGTGFMSVGELANVRHNIATQLNPPPSPGRPESMFRLDGGIVDDNETTRPNSNSDNNDEDFIAAAATLIALNDWATVRSHVFTIYGQIRGAENQNIIDSKEAVQKRLRREDLDARAIRFQETIDRLPTFLGKSLPVRIGTRTVGAYLDESNN